MTASLKVCLGLKIATSLNHVLTFIQCVPTDDGSLPTLDEAVEMPTQYASLLGLPVPQQYAPTTSRSVTITTQTVNVSPKCFFRHIKTKSINLHPSIYHITFEG